MKGSAYDVIVIGGGPSGLMAAICAAQDGARVLLLEKNDAPGKKLLLTGHGRCNITNMQALEILNEKYFEQAKFLNSAFRKVSPQDVREMFAELGVPTHEEENGRIFPDTQKSKTVLDALLKKLESLGVEIRCQASVRALYREQDIWKVVTDEAQFLVPAVVLACGGQAFPQTGSTGDGYLFATKNGHTVQPLIPALAPIQIRQNHLSEQPGAKPGEEHSTEAQDAVFPVTGVTISNVEISVVVEGKRVAKRAGDLLFTHQGFSGPTAMTLSRHLPVPEQMELYQAGQVQILLNYLPDIRPDELDPLLLQKMTEDPNRPIRKVVKEMSQLPERVVAFVLGEEMNERLCHQITKQERKAIVQALQASAFTVDRPASWEVAYVTRGGISLKEIDPKTMQSKLQPGLFFAGEIMDVDGDSGGYNLQVAWASGAVAGHSASTLSTMPQTMMDAQNRR